MRLEDLGLIGNCQFSALVANTGEIVWCCLPRFDSEPVFSTLLDDSGGGRFTVAPAGGGAGEQTYMDNTNVLETIFSGPDGSFRLRDFAPRFPGQSGMLRPTQLVRMLEPLHGTPRVRVRCEPKLGWSRQSPHRSLGSGYLEFEGFPTRLRLATDIPLSYLTGEPFALTDRRALVLTWGLAEIEPTESKCEQALRETVRYWRGWVKHCNVPPSFQGPVIRSALALKLHCFEDTGAIVASTTTSIPEAPGSGRTWDYRYCWLRDAYYALAAFRLLGHFEERESFVAYLLNVAGSSPDLELSPVYAVDGSSDLTERVLDDWPGYEGNGPVRVGNAASRHRQHDIFGEMVLALAPVFLDERFKEERSRTTMDLLERLARKAIAVAGTPDAGIWEYRTPWRIQTFSSLMCWAAADRMALVASRQHPPRVDEFRAAADRIKNEIVARAFNPSLGAFVGSYDGSDLDASLLQMAALRFCRPGDPKVSNTIEAIWSELAVDGWLLRYRLDDGFLPPTVAFTICTFWLIEALSLVGRREEARRVMDRVIPALSRVGLLAEDYEVASLRMWGNFPQAYSHVGLIHAAFAASPSWQEVV